jgi:hypothetical protein
MLRYYLLVLLLTSSLGSVAQAQEPPPQKVALPASPAVKRIDNRELGDGLAPGRRGFLTLLKNPAIVEELELTEEQKAKLKDVEKKRQEFFASYTKEHQQKMIDAQERDKQRDLVDPPQTSREKIERINNSEAKSAGLAYTDTVFRLNDEADAAIARKILDRKQAKRLKEIQAQAEGPTYFDRPEIQESLALEPDQLAEIKRIVAAELLQFRAATVIPSDVSKPAEGREDSPQAKAYASVRETTRNNVMKVRVSTMKAIEQVLSKPQRGKYKKMVGEPFSFYKPKVEPTEKEATKAEK